VAYISFCFILLEWRRALCTWLCCVHIVALWNVNTSWPVAYILWMFFGSVYCWLSMCFLYQVPSDLRCLFCLKTSVNGCVVQVFNPAELHALHCHVYLLCHGCRFIHVYNDWDNICHHNVDEIKPLRVLGLIIIKPFEAKTWSIVGLSHDLCSVKDMKLDSTWLCDDIVFFRGSFEVASHF